MTVLSCRQILKSGKQLKCIGPLERLVWWNEITFPADWTLENENHTLQIQNPAQNPDLIFVDYYLYQNK